MDATEPAQRSEQGGRGTFRSLQRGKWLTAVVAPLVLFAAATACFRWTNADLMVCRQFYLGQPGAWKGISDPLWRTIHDYAPLPGLAMGFAGLAMAFLGVAIRRMREYVPGGLFLAGLLAVGPGLIVNVALKELWDRPRPRQVVEFGGDSEFVRVGDRGKPGAGRSLPSGHAAMGFYLMAPAFLLYRRHPRAALGFLLAGAAAGTSVGVARIAQGAHFPSDVLWSAGSVYFSAVLLSCVVGRLKTWRCPRGREARLSTHERGTAPG